MESMHAVSEHVDKTEAAFLSRVVGTKSALRDAFFVHILLFIYTDEVFTFTRILYYNELNNYTHHLNMAS